MQKLYTCAFLWLLTPLVGMLFFLSPSKSDELVQVAQESFPELYEFSDTCNVYVLKVGEEALLIDLGDGNALSRLAEQGVKSVDWILFTHHHREQCQGIDRVDRLRTKVATGAVERELFEQPLHFRKWYPNLNDRYSVYGASFVRPPMTSIPIDRALKHLENFTWKGFEIECLETPGHSPGSMTYVITRNGKKFAFTGDLIHEGAKMVTWFDSEWDYGFAVGLDTLIKSVERMIAQNCDYLLPSHGPIIDHSAQLSDYRDKLTNFRSSYVRGYPVFDLPNEKRDSLSKATQVPLLNQVTPHLYKLSDSSKGRNFAMIIADSGRALVLDCGLLSEADLDELVQGAKTHLGLKGIDAFWISHMHGDHFLLGPAMKQKYGAEAWTLDRIVDRCENPRNYDYAALVSAYDDGFDGMKIDRSFHDGEVIKWEGYRIQIDWMPGQTEFGCCLWLELDGQRIAFTGDNLFGYPADPNQNGHEAVVARNSCIFQEGYLLGSKYLKTLRPDIVMGSHSFVMDQPADFLTRYHDWSKEILGLYQDLLPDKDYEYLFDPYWVSAYPYRVPIGPVDGSGPAGGSGQAGGSSVAITVRNFRDTKQTHFIEIKTPEGILATPSVIEGTIDAKQRKAFNVVLTLDPDAPKSDSKEVQIVALDITLDGKHYGQWFDFLVKRN